MEISKSECPDSWTRLPRHKWPKTWSNHRRSSRSSWGKSVWSPICWINGRKTTWKSSIGFRMEKVPSLECWFVHRKQGLFFRCPWWTSECLEGQIHNPMWKKLLKLVDPGERTSFLDKVFLGCFSRECKLRKSYWGMQTDVRMTNLSLCWSNSKVIWLCEISREKGRLVF